jgi:hypothetical protein
MRKEGIFFILIFLLAVVSAVSLGNPVGNVDKNYLDKEFLSGKVNLSFDDFASSNLIVKYSGGEESKISVSDFVENSKINFSCNPKDCKDDYQTSGSSFNSKSISLSNEKTLGFVLVGKNVDIKDFELSISSNSGASCENQLEIDFLDDEEVNWINSKYSLESCGSALKSSCNQGGFPNNVVLDAITYCDKINLSVSPSFEVSAGIQRTGGSYSAGDLKAYIFKKGVLMGSCDLTNPSISRSSCIVNYVNKKQEDHFVCVSLKEGGASGQYSLPANLGGGCGFHWDPAQNPEAIASYDISVLPKKYSAIGNFNLNSTTFSNQNLINVQDYIENYLQEKYQKECLPNCVVPIKFSGSNQVISVSNLKVSYDVQGGSGLSTTALYELEKTPAKIRTNQTIFDLSSGNFVLPKNNGNYSVDFYLDNNLLMKENISVYYSAQGPKSVIQQIYPRSVAAAYPTNFIVFLDPAFNSSDVEYVWDFGSGSYIRTTENKATYTFSNIGNYSVKVSVFKGVNEIGSRTFEINSQSPKDSINSTLKDYKQTLDKVKSQINILPESYRNVFDEFILVDDLNTQLTNFEDEYKQFISSEDTLESDYVYLMTQVVNFNLPLNIQPSMTTNLPFILEKDKINLIEIENLFGDEDYESEDLTKNEILSWFFENIDASIETKVLSVYYRNSQEDLLTEFNIVISPKKTLDYKGYFVIGQPEETLIFNGVYSFSDKNDGSTGILIDLNKQTEISFAKEGNVDFLEGVDFYLAPKLSEINSGKGELSEPKSYFWWFVLAFGGLFVLTFIVYVFLKNWYDKNYENYLFKNKADLNNLLYFLRNARRQGLSDDAIKSKLKNSKWSGEQINYALNTYVGKKEKFGFSFFKKK